ncbi:hypothetical protein F511_14753 [Dorcoceras hygrometricum]|uniref:Homologous recombination OB-fold protein OB-fold domain-containing protein n=1 Tax=Dorcoceras hygrometricum TaxID=472368 RepID=A0A2Z7AVF0_9LAMI|nr:hypothetical protein F511_14753 [Dorcoceras hygrometricum]
MELDPWQDLDIDDSDLPSLLRPCKRRRSPTPAASQIPPENVHRTLLSPHPIFKTASGSRIIPGPAGTVHAAMLRKALDRSSLVNPENSLNCSNGDAVIPTQEYIRRAVEDTAEFDDDFSRTPWLSAVRFLGGENGVNPGTPISSIKKHLEAGKVNQVVAVIKSCSPTSFGGLKVILKDPSGSVCATVHPKVLSESGFGKKFNVGAVLILQKVAIFSPARTALYLNITLRNVVKVFCHDDSYLALDDSAHSVQYHDAAIDYGKMTKICEKLSVMQKVTREDTTEETTRDTGSSETLHIHSSHSFKPKNREVLCTSAAMTVSRSNLSQHAYGETPEEVSGTKLASDPQDNATDGSKCAKVGNSDHSLLSNYSGTKSRGEDIQETDEVQTQRQPQREKSFVPQWTDEQLDELFTDYEYSGF